EVPRPEPAGVVRAPRVPDDGLAAAARRRAAGLHGCQMRPPSAAAPLRAARARQLRRHVPADGAGAEDADLHLSSPSFAARPMRCSFPVGPRGSSVTKTILCGTL